MGCAKGSRPVLEETAAGVVLAARELQTDLSAVRAALHEIMLDTRHDAGSLAPLLIRFTWHCCGTYDESDGTGGPNGSTMRFPTECQDPENAGLDKARQVLVRRTITRGEIGSPCF